MVRDPWSGDGYGLLEERGGVVEEYLYGVVVVVGGGSEGEPVRGAALASGKTRIWI